MKKSKGPTERMNEQRGPSRVDFADIIERLMDERNLSQKSLSGLVGVTQGTISVWLNRVRGRAPSREKYIDLVKLVTEPKDIICLLELAGLSRQDVEHAAREIGKQRYRAPKKRGTVNIYALPESADCGGIPVAKDLLEHPESTHYFLANEQVARMALAPGVIILDTKNRGSDLAHFWAATDIVLAKLPEGYLLGGLTSIDESQAKGLPSGLSVGGYLTGIGALWRFSPVRIGAWRHPILGEEDCRERLEQLSKESLQEERNRFLREMKADAGHEIVGRVEAWLPDRAAH